MRITFDDGDAEWLAAVIARALAANIDQPTAGWAGGQSEWMTLPEVAEHLRVAESTLRYWRVKGSGPASARRGRRIYYRRADVDAWMAAGK